MFHLYYFPVLAVFSSISCLFLAFLQVALWTLGQQVASTGYVVEPYRKYPSLLEVLLNFLKTEQNQGIRREVCTVACRGKFALFAFPGESYRVSMM